MGMAANQARLMSITARKSDLELRAQQISAAKIRLSSANQEIAKNFTNALNNRGQNTIITKEIEITKEWLQSNSYVLYNGSNESSSLNDLSQAEIDALLAQGYKAYRATTSEITTPGTYNISDAQKVDGLCTLFNANWSADGWLATPALGQNGTEYYLNFDVAAVAALGCDCYGSSQNTLQAVGNPYFAEHNGTRGSFSIAEIANVLGIQPTGGTTTTSTSYSLVSTTVTEIIENEDIDFDAAKAEYDASMVALSSQEKILDMELTQINTEHKAVNTEYDAIKSLIKDNTEKSFNVFG